MARVSERIGREQRDRSKQRREEAVRTGKETAEQKKVTLPSRTR